MSGYVKLGAEVDLFPGHTLSLIIREGYFLGYKGEVYWEGITVLKGGDLMSLKEVNFMDGLRWGSAIGCNGKVYLFCTKQSKKDSNPWRYQDIYLYESGDGINFSEVGKFTSGSAPFIYRQNGKYHLFYHEREPHRILLRTAKEIKQIRNAKPIELIKSKYIISAPSVCHFNGYYWLTCERRLKGRDWDTPLFKGKNFYSFVIHEDPLLDKRACAFQHIFGDRLILTSSFKRCRVWWLMLMEGRIED